MGTRSNIGIINDDETFEVIYCHWDGYPAHNGKILSENYTKVLKIRKLISLGDISILAPEIGRKTDFDNPKDGQVIAYGRDRGEANTETSRYSSYDEYADTIDKDSFIEYIYVFNKKVRKWYYTTHENRYDLFDLKDKLTKG